MVKHPHDNRGSLTVELVVAMGILTAVLIPLAYSFVAEQRQCRVAYQRAVTMEIVDGEMEVLMAGEWHRYDEGAHVIRTASPAAQNLPNHELILTVRGRHLRLACGPIVREADAR